MQQYKNHVSNYGTLNVLEYCSNTAVTAGSWLFKHRNTEWRHNLCLFSVVTALLFF
jgi:hypothetical protein